MDNKVVSATSPDLLNKLAAEATAEKQEEKKARILSPSDNLVTLPGGYISDAGEVIKTAEVRELNGLDEEAISRTNNFARILFTIMSRATVKIGEERATPEMIDSLLVGDRDALLLGIYKATFGPTSVVTGYCNTCQDTKEVEVEIDSDIQVKSLEDPISDRTFTVTGKKGEYQLSLPTGFVQKAVAMAEGKTAAELNTILLRKTVFRINGQSVISDAQIQNLPLVDRKALLKEIEKRNPGPQLSDIFVDCPDCDGKVVVPINFGTLFQL